MAAVVPHSTHTAPEREPETAVSLRAKANVAAHELKLLEATYADALRRVCGEEGVMLEAKSHAHLELLRASNDRASDLEEAATGAEAAYFALSARGGKRGPVRRTSTHETDAKRETGGNRAPERPPNPLVDAGPRRDVNEPVGAPRPRAPRGPSPFSRQKPKPDSTQANANPRLGFRV